MISTPEKPRRRHPFWRIFRTCFRRFRISVWVLALLVLGGLLYLNQIGLPGFVKNPLLQKLRARGVDLQFSRLRLRWYEGIVAENVRYGRVGDPLSPQLTLAEVQVPLNLKALVRLQLQPDKLILRQGKLVWPIRGAGSRPRYLSINNIHSDLAFLPDDRWALDNFKADFAGAKIQLSGVLTNASFVPEWEFFHGQRTAPASVEVWQRRLRRLADALERIHFSAAPELHMHLRGDARELQSFMLNLVLAAPGAETPWGTVTDGHFTAHLLPADTNGVLRAQLSLEASSAQVRFSRVGGPGLATNSAAVTNFQLGVQLESVAEQPELVHGSLNLSAASASTEWARASNAVVSATWIHSITNAVPISGQAQLDCAQPITKWGRAARAQVSARLATPSTEQLPATDRTWAWWTNLQPYWLDWECHLSNVEAKQLTIEQVSSAGNWRAPVLSVTNLEAQLYQGRLDAEAELNVVTRALKSKLSSTFDPHKISPVLTEGARQWLEQYSWGQPPRLEAEAQLVLPSWTNRQPDWRRDVQPTLKLAGEFEIAGGAYRQVQVDAARSHFSYTNLCWRLPDLTLTRPEGNLRAEHFANDRTRNFYWRINSGVDLRIFQPVLEPGAQRVLDLFSFTNPPVIDCEIWGRFHEPERTAFRGEIALTNFAFRGQAFSSVQTGLAYTNRVLQFFAPRVERNEQQASADGLAADFKRELVFLTNGLSNMDPLVIARAIGPHIGKAIEPYRFESPPAARVYGVIPMRGEEGADLHFELDGGPFAWWKFRVPHISGQLHWAGLHLFLNDVRLPFYEGKAVGAAEFDFVPHKKGTGFKFSVATTNTLLQALMADLSSRTNTLEGYLNGTLAVTQGNTEDWHSLFGYGNLDLRDGLIWDIPLFGIFSPVLNGISPGLGNSRATAAACTFVMTAGVIRADDLEIHSPALRLLYHGTVDLESRLNARVEAELLRDVWLVGPIVSTIFWPVSKMFEYKVTGTLHEPKTEPVYIIPKLVLAPFHSFRRPRLLPPPEPILRTNAPITNGSDLLPATNAPPVAPELQPNK